MVDWIDNFCEASHAVTVFAALACFAFGLTRPDAKRLSMSGLVGAVVCGTIGLIFGLSAGPGWGMLFGPIFGALGACSGFLLGFSVSGLMSQPRRILMILPLLLGLYEPVAWALVPVKNARIAKDRVYWEAVMSGKLKLGDPAESRSHLSREVKGWLSNELARFDRPLVPTTVTDALHSYGVDVSSHANLGKETAKAIYAENPKNGSLARNPSTPKEILAEMSNIDDYDLLRELALNTALPLELRTSVKTRAERHVAEASAAVTPDYYRINKWNDVLKMLAWSEQRAAEKKAQTTSPPPPR